MEAPSDIACFVAVAERGSFTVAAGHLGVSRSLLSKEVSRLEDRLGARLMNRTTRRLSLTEVGQSFFDSARRGLQEIAEAEAAVTHAQSAPRGTLRLNVPMSFGLLQLAPALPEFLRRHPELTLDVQFDDRRLDLIQDGFDAAVRIGELPDSSLVVKRLGACPHVLCAAPAYLKKAGTPKTPDDLVTHNAISYGYSDAAAHWEFTAPNGRLQRVAVKGNTRMNNSLALREMLLAGVGITLTPRFIVGPDLRSGRLKEVLAGYRLREPSVFVVYPERRHLSPKVRAFVDFVAERLTGTADWRPAPRGAGRPQFSSKPKSSLGGLPS